MRKATYSHGNIIARSAFTIGIPSEAHVQAVDRVGLVSGREVDKFADVKLTPVRSDLVDAPYVGEFPMVLECRLAHTIELGLHTQFVGEVVDVKVDETAMTNDGNAEILTVKPLVYAPDTQAYYGIGGIVAKAFSVGKSA